MNVTFAVFASIALSASAPTQPDPWHRLLEKKARASLAPHSKDYPKGYGDITCNPVEDVKTEGPYREAVIECALATSCGPSGTLFLYRRGGSSQAEETKTSLQFSVPTSGYMGGYYELKDLNRDGYPEVITVSGTDGVAASYLTIQQRINHRWVTVPTSNTCGTFCSAHDYLFVTDPASGLQHLISVRGCELERGNGKPCQSALAKISLNAGTLDVAPLIPNSQEPFHKVLDAAVAAVHAVDRKELERNDVTIQILGEIYELAGIKRPPSVEPTPADTP